MDKKEFKAELSSIKTHIEMLIDPEEQERIGADEQPQRDLQQRVMRIFAAYNDLLLENKNLKSQKEPCEYTCYHHQTHPCEKCGRINGYLPSIWKILNGR